MTTIASSRAKVAEVMRRASFYQGFLALIAMALALAAWALSSPVGSSPDEDYHLASIWCSHGTRAGSCEPAAQSDQRQVLESFATSRCFAFQPQLSAACQGDSLGMDHTLVATDRGNFIGSYPPVFYWVMGLFVGPHIIQSVLVMRFFNVVLGLALASAVWLASPPGVRRGLVAGGLLTLIPLGAFIVASINPSSWAMLSALTLLVCVTGYLMPASKTRRVLLGALAAVALVLGSGARADASAFAVVAIGAAIIITWRRPTRRRLLQLLYPAALAVVAAIAFTQAGQSEALTNTQPKESTLNFLVRVLVDVPTLWTGALGQWGLGWLDTSLPALVWVASWSSLVGVVFAALRGIGRLQSFVVMAAGAGVWVVSGYMQYVSGYPVPGAVQPRYILPLIVIVVIAACIRLDGPPLKWSTSQWMLIVAALSVANSLSLYFNLRRYITGTDAAAANLDRGIEWWWGISVPPMAVWALGSVAFFAAATLLTWRFRRDEPTGPGRPVVAEGHSSVRGEAAGGPAPAGPVELMQTAAASLK